MEFTSEVRKATEPIYQKISKILPEIEWSTHAPYIHKINKLKKENKILYIIGITTSIIAFTTSTMFWASIGILGIIGFIF